MLAEACLADLVAARDRIDVRQSIPCDQCGAQFVPVARPGGREHRFCSRRCQDDARNARKRIRASGKRDEMKAMPYLVTQLESIPWEVRKFGLCVHLDEAKRHLWTSDDPGDIALAESRSMWVPCWLDRCPRGAVAPRALPRRFWHFYDPGFTRFASGAFVTSANS